MIDRILTLSEDNGFPIIPGTDRIIEHTEGHFTAHGPEESAPKGALNRYTHPTIAQLWRAAPGLYAVAAESDMVAVLDPTSKGKTMEDYDKTAAADTWPCKNDDGTIAVPSIYGPNDPRPFKIRPITIVDEIPI